ncbi:MULTISPECIES: hypothetical protein [Kitasatospora]|uniref:Uncharacterized protein n=1 Tax=Kitasatospora setae (strain ATCC 33774 / DSM 43861 / JCM 3304 / KCC A-0304 / NBRC 14216 / KM-6054) TaxID=452652 RepID=E4NG67_KITSK|nr:MULTISPECIES: hypothetical protein [Kitasatospora]BAJ30497.1 hypothetical protein KSE_47170 [Kitasatospora setae KM-6054]
METGIPLLDTVLLWGGVVTVLATLGVGGWKCGRVVLRLAARAEELADDCFGEPARPGVPPRPAPGALERVAAIEARVAAIEHEVHPSDGGSLRDVVDLANRRLAQLCPAEADGDPPPAPLAS